MSNPLPKTKAATMSKSITVSGVLVSCQVVDEASIDFNYTHKYSPNTEHRNKFLKCELKTDDNKTVYFNSPRSEYRVSSCPGAAVITFKDSEYNKDVDKYIFPDNHPWFSLTGDKSVSTPNNPSDKVLVAKVNTNDRITIKGRVKYEKVSKQGNPYIVLTHVKKV